jgi:hypothetical protein
MSTASALSDHYATHAQLIQSDTHAPLKALGNVLDGNRPILKCFQNNVIKRHIGPMLCAKHSANIRRREHASTGVMMMRR